LQRQRIGQEANQAIPDVFLNAMRTGARIDFLDTKLPVTL